MGRSWDRRTSMIIAADKWCRPPPPGTQRDWAEGGALLQFRQHHLSRLPVIWGVRGCVGACGGWKQCVLPFLLGAVTVCSLRAQSPVGVRRECVACGPDEAWLRKHPADHTPCAGEPRRPRPLRRDWVGGV